MFFKAKLIYHLKLSCEPQKIILSCGWKVMDLLETYGPRKTGAQEGGSFFQPVPSRMWQAPGWGGLRKILREDAVKVTEDKWWAQCHSKPGRDTSSPCGAHRNTAPGTPSAPYQGSGKRRLHWRVPGSIRCAEKEVGACCVAPGEEMKSSCGCWVKVFLLTMSELLGVQEREPWAEH